MKAILVIFVLSIVSGIIRIFTDMVEADPFVTNLLRGCVTIPWVPFVIAHFQSKEYVKHLEGVIAKLISGKKI